MDKYTICNINESLETIDKAAKILLETMPIANMWPDLNEEIALKTVDESIADENISIGIKVNNQLIGWAGLMPMYKNTWELHPMAILPKFQGKSYGKILLNEIEKIAQKKGIIGIFVGSDDETNKTSLSEVEITKDNIFEEIKRIKNYENHPYEFYMRCGYSIIGIIPNANGSKKPDILLWKDIRNNKN
jgi:aminoglycoside 6'-N-acetyltransferase I